MVYKAGTMKLQELDLLKIGNSIQMAGTIYQGEGRTFLCFFPEDKNDQPIEALEMTREQWDQFVQQTDLLQTEVLTQASDGTLAKIVLRKSTRHIEQGVSWRVFKRDGYACRYCGGDDIPLTVDHLVCWEDGGPSTVENLVSACRRCNKVRGSTPFDEWLDDPRYQKVAGKLTPEQRARNEALVATLAAIPRLLHPRSR
jgi:hypothetical protein